MSTFLSRGIDYLGDLGAKLRDLRGDRTLAYELIQNADDARNATWMCFNVCDDALIVDNDGTFSDCGKTQEAECPWKEDGRRGHRCDFHRFRRIASGDKRGEAGTTGAFGIGFIAVYQITDRPEVISVSQHWILHEECPEDQRIEVCSGCVKCSEPSLPGTRFILPWAWSASSALRQMLRAEPVSLARPEQFLKELQESIPIAMLFLKRLKVIELKGANGRHCAFQRNDEGDSLILSDGNAENDRIWHLIRGDFSDAAAELSNKHPGRIEEKRSSRVIVAVPGRSIRAGFLCACLPTEQDIGLPFHVNADFFPTNDRKHIILADDYQSTWNREALRAAARAIGTALERLPATLGAQQFWRLISAAKEVADSTANDGESTFAEFWRAIEPHLRSAPVVYTTKDSWVTSSRTSLLLQREENDVIPVLEGLGITVVHEDLRPYHNLLRSDSVGIPLLDIKTVCDALTSRGLDRRIKYDALPTILTAAAGQQLLWSEITRLLDRQQRTYKARLSDEDRLRQVAIAPGRDGDFWPCGQIYSADEATRILFESLDMGIPFVASEEGFAALAFLCPPFDAAAAIDRLSAADNEILDRAWQENRLPLKQLFAWFEDRRQEICGSETIKQKFIKLQIFPSSEKLRTFKSVALPGNFDDPLRLAELVDLNALGGRREFLRDLGMPELDFRTYVLKYLPSALKDYAVTADKRRAANVLLAKHIGELREYPEALRALTMSALVECSDDVFREPSECYFDSDVVRECLGDAVCFAALPNNHQTTVRELYTWLGVAQKPRRGDVMKMIQGLGSKPYVHSAVTRMKRIITYLGTGFEAGDDPVDLMPLKSTRWLPARGKTDRWYSPNELYALYQAHLFESQALFLDLSDGAKSHSALLEFFGVKLTPPASLVVKHLMHCAIQKVAVNAGVYRFLNDKAGDPSIDVLKNKSCLWLGGVYRAPFQVYWGEHPFGRYRWRLNEELRSYNRLLTQLGIRDTPEYGDSLNVLKEISAEFGATNTPLDAETLSVVRACWQLLEKAFDEGTVSAEQLRSLHSLKCIPNSDHILYPPEWIFFENRAGLAAKFGDFLTRNVIPRPVGGLRAFSAAGVRPLGSAVQIELLERTDPVDDSTMAQRIRSRRNQIGRVLESQSSGVQTTGALSELDGIRCEATSSLVLRYRLRAFNRELRSEPESTPAVFQRADNALMFTRHEGHSWGAIARELAVALFPDEDPGRFAAGLKEVLAPESATEASNVLDELGFARLDTTVHQTPKAGQAGSALGVDVPSSDFGAPGLESTSPVAPGYLSVEGAVDRILGPNAPAPSRPISEATAEPSGIDGPSGTRKSSGQANQKCRPVLRSYVPNPVNVDGDANGLDEQDNESGLSPVDVAGIRRVMEYELENERTPKEMPHNNRGYDIESRDTSGKVGRYIEVKSFSGDWDSTYAVLSRPQFDKASELREMFWLYVVERAELDDFYIHRIQNPAVKANHFMFDDGWRVTAEPETRTKKGI